ncbi:phosphatase PAP2 family protein [Candidatus Riflebacteria bacterium]
MSYLLAIDEKVLFVINNTLSHEILDPFFIFITSKYQFGFVVGCFLIYFLYTNFTLRRLFWGLILAIALADVLSARVFKKYFGRQRPCVVLAGKVRVPYKVKQGNSFPSSHASNVFAAVGFLYIPFKAYVPGLVFLAATVAYSRVYLGVHYPSDVIAGGFGGFLLGIGVFCLIFREEKTGPQIEESTPEP